MKHFLGTDEGLELKIVSRGMPPDGRGEVHFQCPVRQKLRPVQLLDAGKIKRIRGVAYTVRVSPNIANRLVEAAKGILLQYIPDVYIYTDQHKGKQAGKSPGFGLSLVAETMNGSFLAAESASNPPGSGKGPSIAEDVGKEAAMLLLEEVYRGGYVDSNNQGLACLFMALGQTDVSKILTGPLSPYTMSFLRHMKDFLQIMFKLEVQKKNDEEENLQLGTDKVILTCVGIGFTNLSKKVS
ncbi:RNA 3'-terminal phosphate cyclase-like protein [Limulus polyphemus]|uniref:RNA 3'-terminal phosphate cyclase-like protein n=1 Tax=Limulus polyphemus TaxID=6850 RepID=A0ABM1SY80_LIMPO|nr:RNA 3'-terminal phosphate cyclase-like protein [Limulus polyphemus]